MRFLERVPRGDPGDRRLHQLAVEPIFDELPRGAELVERVLTPATYRKPGFTGGGWSGPGVTLIFRSESDPRSVFAFCDERAQASGWVPTAKGSLHMTNRWRKDYPNGAQGWLSIFTPASVESAPAPHTYRLAGGISLPD